MQRQQSDLLGRLKAYQSQKRMSGKTLAKRLGVSPVTLAQWFERHRKLRPRECQVVEKFLDQRR